MWIFGEMVLHVYGTSVLLFRRSGQLYYRWVVVPCCQCILRIGAMIHILVAGANTRDVQAVENASKRQTASVLVVALVLGHWNSLSSSSLTW